VDTFSATSLFHLLPFPKKIRTMTSTYTSAF
jgi:hypothetical protein